ncbi:MAG: hypothetical protein GY725_02250 [bacterium]|nr:hypothetical protein [bacterium]
MLAGVARKEITPSIGVELMGYGARVGAARNVAQPLFTRALFLSPEDPQHTGIIIVSADLCLMGPGQAELLRRQIEQSTRVPVHRVLVACTHTHSGPETGLADFNSGRELPEHVAPMMDGIVEAARLAWQKRRPARFGWSTGRAPIGRNRRVADDPVDSQVGVLRVVDARGAPMAVLFQHACHGTVLGHDNLDLSPDWAGLAAARIESETGAIAPFLLGAHADIDPRTRGLMDIAISGQSIGVGHDGVRVLGAEVADSVLAALDDAVPVDAPVDAATAEVPLMLHLGDLSPDEERAQFTERKKEIAALLGVDVDEVPRLASLWNAADHLVATLPVREARERIARVREYVRDKSAPFFVGGKRRLDVEIQVLRVGEAALLALPVEPTTRVGLDWKARSLPSTIGSVVGIGNGWLRYLPHADDLSHPCAHQHYEVLSSLFAPDSCERLLEAGDRLRTRLF